MTMIYHAFAFWGLIRPDGDFNCLHDMVNDLFTDLSIDITHYGGESKKYHSNGYRTYKRVIKKLLDYNEKFIDFIDADFAFAGKTSKILGLAEVQIGFITNELKKLDSDDNRLKCDKCYFIIKQDYMDENFNTKILPKVHHIANYILDVVEYQHLTTDNRMGIIPYIYGHTPEQNDYVTSINVLEREIPK